MNASGNNERDRHCSRFAISTLILAGYALILLAVVGLGWFATRNMEQLRALTQNFYVHPFAVSNAAANMKGTLFQLRNHMVQIVLIRNRNDNVEQLRLEADGFARTARADLAVIKANFLGDMDRGAELEMKFDQWDAIRTEILRLAENGDLETAERLVKTVGTPKFLAMVPLLDYVLTFAKDRGKRYVDEAEKHSEQIILRARWLVGVLTVFIMLTGFAVIRRVMYLQNELHRQATIDYLTGIPNRRHFMELADRELARHQRYGDPFALAVVDLDLFKKINDTHGHHVGDRVLKAFCDACRKTLRESDIVGRIGGEEFAILLPSTTLAEAQDVVERVRKTIEETSAMVGQASSLRFTASFGLANYSVGDDDMTALFRHADEALYEAKRAGRNRVCVRRHRRPEARRHPSPVSSQVG